VSEYLSPLCSRRKRLVHFHLQGNQRMCSSHTEELTYAHIKEERNILCTHSLRPKAFGL